MPPGARPGDYSLIPTKGVGSGVHLASLTSRNHIGGAKEWAQVVNSKIGFHETSGAGNSYSNTGILERNAERLKAERRRLELEMSKLGPPKKVSAPTPHGKASCISHQYQTEAGNSFLDHQQFKTKLIMHKKDPNPRGVPKGVFASWADLRKQVT